MRFPLLFIIVLSFAVIPFVAAAADAPAIHFFYSSSCPHCRAEQKFLDSLEEKYPELEVRRCSVNDAANISLLKEKLEERGAGKYFGVVPVTFVGDKFFVGFDLSLIHI